MRLRMRECQKISVILDKCIEYNLNNNFIEDGIPENERKTEYIKDNKGKEGGDKMIIDTS